MVHPHAGELFALLTALCWTVAAMSFEAAGRRVGSLAVNFIRLVLALLFHAVFSLLMRGSLFPLDAPSHAWLWLSLSGLVGFTIGDLLLFRALVVVGARVSMLMMALVPPITALIGWAALGETLSARSMAGMAITVAGIILVVLKREKGSRRFALTHSITGILLAFGGALGQAGGLILSKYGMSDYDPFASTQIRVIAGTVGFAALFSIMGFWPRVASGLKNPPAMSRITLGAFFGPFLGVSFSLFAVQRTATGIASTIMGIVPVLIIAPAMLIFREKITAREMAGSALAVSGVALFFG
ncbi:MAG TPA: DMT family transporter [Spirochaetota bacterium]|nr:DMT family transporter [Spirochaetota bacterium]